MKMSVTKFTKLLLISLLGMFGCAITYLTVAQRLIKVINLSQVQHII